MTASPPDYCLFTTQDVWWTICMPRPDWASWMQALGAIAAICAAIYIARRDHRIAELRMIEHEKRIRQLALLALENIEFVCDGPLPWADVAGSNSTAAGMIALLLRDLGSPLANAPIWTMRDTSLANDIEAVRSQLVRISSAVETAPKGVKPLMKSLAQSCRDIKQKYPAP